jgi:hypothetical protein
MTRKFALISLLALVLGFPLVRSLPARAATTIEASSVQNDYPKSLTFKVTAKADADITDITLAYSIKGRGTSALDKPKGLTPARNLSADVTLSVNSSQDYIPVGSLFTYHWEVTTSDGITFTGPDQTFFYLPPDQTWQKVSNDFMTIYYYGDRQSTATAYLQAGQETYDKIGKQLYNVTLTEIPVNVVMFADDKASSAARPGSGDTFDAAVTTCGTKVATDIIIMIPIACGSSDRTDTLRHEFGHILNETVGDGPLGKLPAWLDEGAAVYAQTSPGAYQTAFTSAAKANRLISFSSMTTAPTTASQVDVFYGEAWAMVSFLVQKGGPAKFQQFMSTIKGGKRYDQALTAVYGYNDVAAFETDFKNSVGVAPQSQATPRPTAAPTRASQSQPTTTPTKAPAATNKSSNDDGIGTGTLVIGGIAVFFLLAAVLAFMASMMMANNRKAAAARAADASPPAEPGDWNKPA